MSMLILGSRAVWALAPQYRGIALPPNEFFEALTSYAQQGDDRALRGSLKYLGPLFAAIREKTGEDPKPEIETALAHKSQLEMLAAVRRLIFLDMRVNLEASMKSKKMNESRECILLANIDYNFLSSWVRILNETSDPAIRSALKAAYRSDDEGALARNARKTLDLLGPLMRMHDAF